MANDINITINSNPTYGYNLSRTSYDVRQEINAKVIGVLKLNNSIRKKLLSRNIGNYSNINSNEGIGYISNVYSLETSKPFSLGEEGLLGYTHIYSSDFQKNINNTNNIGDSIQYYVNENLPNDSTKKWNSYKDYTDYINEVYGFKYTTLNIFKNLFDTNKLYGKIDSKTNLTIQSVLYDFLQYDNIKYAMEKTRIGTINPNPLAALDGSITTNINNLTGNDTSLGLITNHLYAHALYNSAKFNSLRKTRYITPEVYELIGNKLSTLSTLSADYRINDHTGRLSYEIGDDYRKTTNYENLDISDIENNIIDSTLDVADTVNAIYRNLIRNNGYKDNFGIEHNRFMPFQPYFNAKIDKNGRISESLNTLLSQTSDDELSSLNEYVDLLGEDIVSQKIYNDESARYFNYLENSSNSEFNRYRPFENEQYDYLFSNKSSLLTSTTKPFISRKIYHFWHEGDSKYWNEFTPVSYGDSDYNAIEKYSNFNLSNLQKKTQDLFRVHNEHGIDTLVGRYHTSFGRDNGHNEVSLMQTAVSTFGLSHGRNLLNKKAYEDVLTTFDKNGYSNPYCRVWTYHNQYSKIGDLIRPFSEKDENGDTSITEVDELQKDYWKYGRVKGSAQRLKDYSVLNKNGFVNISPIKESYNGENGEFIENDIINVKKCMFSIENLAWLDVDKNYMDNISKEQVGPNGGRIMWFPPYDLQFNENLSANWNDTEFIGRGEKIYTYRNSERTGTLSFTLLVDHPSLIDIWRKNNASGNVEDDEQTLLRFFAGCDKLDINNIKTKLIPHKIPPMPEPPIIEPENNDIIFYIFFPNNFSGYDMDIDEAINYLTTQYECNNGTYPGKKYGSYKWEYYVDTDFIDEKLRYESNYIDKNTYKLNTDLDSVRKNKSFSDATTTFNDFINNQSLMNDNEVLSATVYGTSSIHGKKKNNEKLSQRRAIFAKNVLINKFNAKKVEPFYSGSNKIEDFCKTIDVDFIDKHNISGNSSKRARTAKVIIHKTVKKLEISDLSSLTFENTNDNTEIVFEKSLTPIELTRPKLTRKQKRALEKQKKEQREKLNEAMREVVMPKIDDIKGSVNIETTYPSENDIIKELNRNLKNNQIDIASATKYEEVYYEEKIKKYNFNSEAEYFTMLKDNDSFLYSKLIDKVKYFNPAFHSITPEGFNERLSFLHQCTRQGQTNSVSDSGSNTITSAGNLAFGRPPVCVLRIGDFYNTKIVIDSISINYESPQWDMNPEGIGMQPMLAKISLNFKFLGGSDLGSPISRLQNAVTFNYYANQSIYDIRADKGTYDANQSKTPKISGTPWKPISI